MKNILIIVTFLLFHHNVWSQDNTITSYQYWLDNDFSSQQTVSVTPANHFHLQTDVDLSTTLQGIHTFHIRFQDNNNNYSSILSQLFYSKGLNTKIVEYEYWFDNDVSNKVNVTVNPIVNYQLISDFDCSSLTNGMHILNLRFKNDGANWSSVTSNFFQKSANGTSAFNLITSYRYWIDSSYNNIMLVNLTNPVNPYHLIQDFDLSQVPKGVHNLHFQFKDTCGLWSSILTDTITKTALPIANFNFNTTPYCDSTILNLSNFSVDADTYLWDFGDGNQSSDSLPLHKYLVPGNYTISLTVSDIDSGLDSTITQNIQINGYTTNTISFNECTQVISPSGNYIWTTSGTYLDTLISLNGCDSILTCNVIVKSNTTSNLIESTCQSYTAPDGQVYSQSGTYTAIIPNSNGCDSTITIDLTVNNPSSSSITESSCQSYTAPDGQVYSQSGTYLAIIPNSNGCDSTISIDLTLTNIISSITQDELILTAVPNDLDYQWIDCGNNNEPINGETNQIFTVIQNGEYAVIVSNGICADTSTCILIENVDVNELNDMKFNIYPNPTNDILSILYLENSNFNIQILDRNGKIISNLNNNLGKIDVDVSLFSNGVYIIKLIDKQNIVVRRFTKI
jgi:hypothetical protein